MQLILCVLFLHLCIFNSSRILSLSLFLLGLLIFYYYPFHFLLFFTHGKSYLFYTCPYTLHISKSQSKPLSPNYLIRITSIYIHFTPHLFLSYSNRLDIFLLLCLCLPLNIIKPSFYDLTYIFQIPPLSV